MVDLKKHLNGTPLPNWARLIAYGIGLGWVAAIQIAGMTANKQATRDAVHEEVAQLRAAVERQGQLDRQNLEEVTGRLDGLDEGLSSLGHRVDFRTQQTKNDIAELSERVDELARKRH